MFDRVAIIGPGLIGGSMGLAMLRRGLAGEVVGIGRRQVSLNKALAVGAITSATLDLEDGLAGAELIVLATPIGTFDVLAPLVAEAARTEAVVTDVASSKTQVVDTISSALRARPDLAYIPTHPMAGSEQAGPESARADLFEGAVCIITPLSNTQPDVKGRVTRLWRELGSTVVSMTPQAHDRAVARVSHLPHLAASALIALLTDDDARLCGGGLLDTTRVASGKPDLWMDICKTNRAEIATALQDYAGLLRRVADCLTDGDLAHLRLMLETAKQRRDRLVQARAAEREQKAT